MKWKYLCKVQAPQICAWLVNELARFSVCLLYCTHRVWCAHYPPVINPRRWLHHLGGTQERQRSWKNWRPKCSEIWWNCRDHLFDIAACLGTGLDEHDVQLFGSLLSFLNHDLPAGKSGQISALWHRRIQNWHTVHAQLTKWLLGKDYILNYYLTYSPLLLQVCFVPD